MSLNFQDQFYSKKIKVIVGVDEAGRGPLAGPVVAAACVFSRDYVNEDINDSKKLTEKKREQLFDIIKKDALAYGVGIVSAEEIDKINIYEATKRAMSEAINNLKIKFDLILTDAMPLGRFDVIDIVKAYQLVNNPKMRIHIFGEGSEYKNVKKYTSIWIYF